jgi:hypothetical protein
MITPLSTDHLGELKARRRALKQRIQQNSSDSQARVQLERIRAEIDGIEYPTHIGAKS